MRRILTICFCALLGVVTLSSCGEDGPSALASSETVSPSATTTTTEPGPTPAESERWNRAVWINTTNLRILNEAIWVNKTNEATWIAKTNERLAAEKAERDREAARRNAADAAAERRAVPPDTPAAESAGSSGRCGGDLPPCWVMMRESGGNIRARNPSSTASGKWQFLDSTWAGFGGYASAYLAPESVQDAKARILWAGGAGCSHWSAC